MMRIRLGRFFGSGTADRIGHGTKLRSRRLAAGVEGLESRNLMTAATVAPVRPRHDHALLNRPYDGDCFVSDGEWSADGRRERQRDRP